MNESATQAQTRSIPNPNLSLSAPLNIPVPPTANLPSNTRLTLETVSPVTQHGSYEFHRIIKSGEVLKRTRKTKSWKPIYIVLRPSVLSFYRDKEESKLRNQINLGELTAVARQKDPKRKDKHIFALFSPSRNYHLEAKSDQDAQDWVEQIRRQARIDEQEEEMLLASPGGGTHPYRGFERSIDAHIRNSTDDRAGGYSSSDLDAFTSSQVLPRRRGLSNQSANNPRIVSGVEFSGPEGGSFSDLSDLGVAVGIGAARMSALSLPPVDGRPSTSSTQPPPSVQISSTSAPGPPSTMRILSQTSAAAVGTDESKKVTGPRDEERIVYHDWIYLLRSKSKVRSWKKVWAVLRPKGLAFYKNGEEYTALLILPFSSIIDVVEIDPISKSKVACLQIITEERNYRLCALDEESLTRWLGAFKSLLSKRKAKGAALP